MNTIIVYDSQFGNTEQLVKAIAERLDLARLLRVQEADGIEPMECELLIVAGPTQRQRMSPALQMWLERLPRGVFKGVLAATFDTRYRMSRLLTGSAALRIASRLKRAGAQLVVPPESFFVERDVPPKGEKRRHEMEHLEPGEQERAVAWAVGLFDQIRGAQQLGIV